MAKPTIEYAGMLFDASDQPITREIYCIKKGGEWKRKDGQTAGLGLFHHYKKLIGYLWPDADQHRWFNLILHEWINSILLTLMGSKDSGKTRTMSMIAVADYYCFPDNTLGILTSTEGRGLELRIWGDVKSLHLAAKNRYDWLPGHPIDSLKAITTDSLRDDQIRDMRKGLICVPGNDIGNFIGIKQKRRRVYADETQYCKSNFLDSLANLNAGDFKGIFSGNPVGDGDPLDKLAEPKSGWSSIGTPTKTKAWDTNDIGGRCVNLIGTDSPNFDYPQDPEPRFPYMIHQKSIDRVVARFKMNSFQYYQQCVGIRMPGLDAKKVITREMCEQFNATMKPYWMDERRTLVYAVDAAYGNIGGDRCVGGAVEFGRDVLNNLVLACHQPVIIPVVPHKQAGKSPEDQIAAFVKADCERLGIPASNVFYDATGRGSLGTSFARVKDWNGKDVNPIEFGGSPSTRTITNDTMILDQKTQKFRLEIGTDRFSKFVTELWFFVRYVIEANQMRDLPEEVMDEGCRRMWGQVRNDMIEIETKEEMKERTGESPDLFDWLVTACEGARRLGFTIGKMQPKTSKPPIDEWKKKLLQRRKQLTMGHQLTYN